MDSSALKKIVYTGSSMSPTLRPADLLHVAPYDRNEIRPGDVIAFAPQGRADTVIHRVVSVGAQGVKTRGDNNSALDCWVLKPDNVIGRVVEAERRGRPRVVYGGRRGRSYSFMIRALRVINLRISSLLHPIYHAIARLGVFRRWLPGRLRPQLVSFSRPSGMELQLHIGRWVVGRLLPGKRRWEIRRPFRIFVDTGEQLS